MAYNTVLIKRRLTGDPGAPLLSGGELAFNEVDSTLYYGASGGGEGNSIIIGGAGAFVDRVTSQTIGGDKTFVSLTTLSSVSVSPDSALDFGGNTLTNIGEPDSDDDATTKLYVDTSTETLSTEVYDTFVKLTEERAVDLSGGLTVTSGVTADTIYTTSDVEIGNNLTVTGNLSVLGTQVVVNTETVNISGTSTQIDIVNNGTDTGLTVNQTGDQDVAEFKDEGTTALIIKGSSATPGYVGIGTSTPNEKLTVVGSISATGTLYTNTLEVGSGSTSLFVEGGKVGINTETPNEELTVVGSISATEDLYARNGTLTGTLDVSQATTLNSTLYVSDASTFASTVSAAGAVTFESTLNVTGATVVNNSLSATGAVEFDSTLTVDGSTTLNDDIIVVGTASLDNGSIITDGAGTITGTQYVSQLVDFIIDGGSF